MYSIIANINPPELLMLNCYTKVFGTIYCFYKLYFFLSFFISASYYLRNEKISYQDINNKNILNFVFIYFVYVRQWFLLILSHFKIINFWSVGDSSMDYYIK